MSTKGAFAAIRLSKKQTALAVASTIRIVCSTAVTGCEIVAAQPPCFLRQAPESHPLRIFSPSPTGFPRRVSHAQTTHASFPSPSNRQNLLAFGSWLSSNCGQFGRKCHLPGYHNCAIPTLAKQKFAYFIAVTAAQHITNNETEPCLYAEKPTR
jgi:hypothetical protein